MVGKVTIEDLAARLAGLKGKPGAQDVPEGAPIVPPLREQGRDPGALAPGVVQGLSGGDPNAPAPSGSEAELAALLKGAGVGGEAAGDTPITESDLERLLGIQAQFNPAARAEAVGAAGKASGLELLGAGIEGAGAAVAGRAPPKDRLGALLAERRKQAGAGFDTSREAALADAIARREAQEREKAAKIDSPSARAAQALAEATGLLGEEGAEGLTSAEALAITKEGTPLFKDKARQKEVTEAVDVAAKIREEAPALEFRKTRSREEAKLVIKDQTELVGAQANISRLENAAKQLETVQTGTKGQFLTEIFLPGGIEGAAGKFLYSDLADLKSQVDSVMIQSIREIFGGNPSVQEGDALKATAFDVLLQPEQNARKLNIMLSELKAKAQIKQDRVDFASVNGNLDNFTGSDLGSIADFLATVQAAGEAEGLLAGAAPAAGGDLIPLSAPDGRPLMVPPDDVQRLLSAGATRR